MSNNTRTNAVRAILAQNERLLALLEGESVTQEATTTRTTRKATRKAAAPKKGKKAKREGGTFLELREALRQHKAAGAIEAGVSVKVAIERGLMDANGVLLTGAPKAAPKAERRVVAEVKPERKAKATRKARKAPEGPRNADGPRDAQGHITPRSEWALRESLAETGKFDRFEIDALVRG